MVWSLYDKRGALAPKVFSNGKSQQDIVDEVLSEIKKGIKIVFIHGVCGSGKSAIALNIAKELGRASIVVPIKNLQRQYENDYVHDKFVLKNNGEKLKISMITGRNNHACPYLAEYRKEILQTRIKEANANLYNIFAEYKKKPEENTSCDNIYLPCKIEIKNKNLSTLKKYYTENPERKDNSELDLKTMKRFAVAPACPYWCPILSDDKKIKNEWNKKKYKAVNGDYSMYIRKDGCPYYAQFNAYIDSDVIIFNGDQYILETAIGRKPFTDVEIIDECDEFLDNFALEGTINFSRLNNELANCICNEDSEKKLVASVSENIAEVIELSRKYISEKDNVVALDKTSVVEVIKSLVKSDFQEIMGEESYLEHCIEVSKKFYDVTEHTFINFYKDENKKEIFVKFVTINLDKLLKSLIDKNKTFVFMSGTLHSPLVLKDIFGLENFKIIEAETFNQGTIRKLKSGLENDFKFENFNNQRVTREQYLRALDRCVEIAKIPIVVQVSAFADLPMESEIEKYSLKNLISSQELLEKQNQDKFGRLIAEFKEGKTKILFTTRCNRGIDFPFEMCNSVVITKFPYPNTQSLFWKILKKNKPEIFWEFYKDKAHRELLQRVYRSVRAPTDTVFLLSPDIRVLNSNVF